MNKMTDKMTLPFLAELTSVMTDDRARRTKAISLLKKHWVVRRGHFDKIDTEKRTRASGSGCIATSHIHCVFGGFNDRNGLGYNGAIEGAIDKCLGSIQYTPKAYDYGKCWIKNGVEILTAQPNATGSTYSNKCRITVKELKDACKANGIKTAGLDKRGLLNALMKV